MKLKVDEAGHAVVAEGKPVYVYDDGKEAPFDAVHTLGTITRLNGEARGHREAKEALEVKFRAYEGIEDPAAAISALETVKNLAAGDLYKADKVEEIKAAARKAAEEQVAAAVKAGNDTIGRLKGERDSFRDTLFAEKIGGAFSRSKFIGDKAAVPGDMMQAMFGGRFKVEDGKIIGHDNSGNKLYSRTKPGDLAEFDEALEQMVDAYPYRDNILKGTGSSGTGAKQGREGANGQRTLRRAEFEALPALQKALVVKTGVQIVE